MKIEQQETELMKIVARGTDVRFMHLQDDTNYRDKVLKMIEELSELQTKACMDMLADVLRLSRNKFQPVGGLSNMEYINVSDIESLKASLSNELSKREVV